MRVRTEPTVVPVRCAITSGFIFAQRVLGEPKVVCVRRKSNPRCGLGIHFRCVLSLCCPVGELDVQSRVVFLPGLWSCWLCVYLLSLRLYLFSVRLSQVVCALDVCCPSIRLCAFDVNRTRDLIPVYTLFCGTVVLPCAWAYMCSPGLCSCRDYVRLSLIHI